MSSRSSPSTQGNGYGIVVSLEALSAVSMVVATFCLKQYHGEATDSSEGFSTAHRTVKTVACSYEISGPFWHARGATVQIILFCVIAIQPKRRAPFAHTFLEVIHVRSGRIVHMVYIIFCLYTNILVTSMLLTGGSAVVHSLSGIYIAAACFLLPLGTIIYTMFGRIKATFLTDYAHTVAVLIIILYFAFTTLATSPLFGSPSTVYDLLVNATRIHPVEGNAGGSYITMRSQEGAMFFIINIIGNFGTVFLDNGYFNMTITASYVSALPGYILGGISWSTVSFLAATTMGLAAVALESNPAFPSYPNRLDPADVSVGLILSAASVALLGKAGATTTLIRVFMVVTSAMSAQLIA
ncbi:unnamed protein product, partial [Rotaria sp. Silwood2]